MPARFRDVATGLPGSRLRRAVSRFLVGPRAGATSIVTAAVAAMSVAGFAFIRTQGLRIARDIKSYRAQNGRRVQVCPAPLDGLASAGTARRPLPRRSPGGSRPGRSPARALGAWIAALALPAFLALALAAPAAAQTSVTLVTNTGQTRTHSAAFSNDEATSFTTGSHSAGYKLTSVDIKLRVAPTTPVYSVSIREDSSGNPGTTSLGTLTNPTGLSNGWQDVRYTTASGTDIDLDADTTYWVVIDASTVGNWEIGLATSNAEDSGAAAGWSIGNNRRWRSNMATTWLETTLGTSNMISIRGYARVPPPEAPERSPEAQGRALKKTLAGVASRTLTSALGHIGARFGDTIPSGNLTLAGQVVNLAAPAAGAYDAHGACPSDAFGENAPGCVGWSRGVGVDELLHASAFSLALGAAEGSGGADAAMPRWSVWGLGDYATFAGRPEGIHYDGAARSGWLGVDARAGRWVAGLALSHGMTEADYRYGDGDAGAGRLETTLTALYPYGRWTIGDGLELRGVLGGGTGEVRHVLGDGTRETGALTMRMASAGVRQELSPVAGIDLAARADAGTVGMEVGDGPGTVAGVSADSWRVRLGLEASRRYALNDAGALTPFVEAVGRRDGGDGLVGNGLEVAGGVRYAAPRVEVELRGRTLVVHTEDGASEQGVSVTARVGPGAEGRGLWLSLSPRWGAAAGGAQALWRDGMPRPSATGAGNEAAMDARIGYGVALTPEGLLTPFAETGLAGDEGRRLRLGTRFDASHMDLGMELSGERRESADADPGHALRLDLMLRF